MAIQTYENASGPPDSQSFKKATLEFDLPAKLPVGKRSTVRVLRSYYSEGASAWVTKGAYSWASDPFHEVVLSWDGSGVHAILRQTFEMTDASTPGRPQPKDQRRVEYQCLLQRQTVAELDPWSGSVGTSSGSFYGPM